MLGVGLRLGLRLGLGLGLVASAYPQAANQTAFRSAGSTTWTVPTNVTRVDVLVVGGGQAAGGDPQLVGNGRAICVRLARRGAAVDARGWPGH